MGTQPWAVPSQTAECNSPVSMHLLWSETMRLLEELIILIWILLNFFLSTKTHEWNACPLAFILALPLIHGPFTALWWQNGGHDHQMANGGEGLRWGGCGLVSWPTWSPHSWVEEFVAQVTAGVSFDVKFGGCTLSAPGFYVVSLLNSVWLQLLHRHFSLVQRTSTTFTAFEGQFQWGD